MIDLVDSRINKAGLLKAFFWGFLLTLQFLDYNFNLNFKSILANLFLCLCCYPVVKITAFLYFFYFSKKVFINLKSYWPSYLYGATIVLKCFPSKNLVDDEMMYKWANFVRFFRFCFNTTDLVAVSKTFSVFNVSPYNFATFYI